MKIMSKYILLLSLFSSSYIVAKPFVEFKQAVTRYTKYTDHHCLQNVPRNTDENSAYKKELRYLFKNYGTFSVATLLSRLRSAHQAMVKQDTNSTGEAYQRYEQISSALLLVCAHIFFNEMRSQILHSLYEIDNILLYWQYQYNHQMHYFFNKSPIKWIIGKKQEKEIVHHILRLERKQRELYTLLGSLTEHAHSFTEMGTTYQDCYTWVEKLLEIAVCIKPISRYSTDDSRFDQIAAQLESKLKRIHEYKADCMTSIAVAKKPGHFTRNWMVYTTAIGIMTWLVRYQRTNPEVVTKALEKIKIGIGGAVTGVILDPLIDLWKVFFGVNAESSVSNIEKRKVVIENLAKGLEAKVNELTNEEIKSLHQYSQELLKQVLDRMNHSQKEEIMKEVAEGKLGSVSALYKDLYWGYYYDNKLDVGIADIALSLNDTLNLLQKYPEIIDRNILPLLQQIGFLFGDVADLITNLSKNHYWTARLSAFAPMAALCLGNHKIYKHFTKRNYSPIRIALADVNFLLIEAAHNLDDHDYGKLVFLIYKLRDRATQLKDSSAHEFLGDVAKLESKQYSVQIKHGIVENMFNKYAFLGKIAV